FVSLWSGHDKVDFSNVPLQLFFGNYNATSLLNAADVENNTAAAVVLINNNEFVTNISDAVKGYEASPTDPCTLTKNKTIPSALCQQVDFFLNKEPYHIDPPCTNYPDNTVQIAKVDTNDYSQYDKNASDSFLDPRLKMQINPQLNFLNLFIIVDEENYNTSIDFMVNYIYNSSICGYNTPYTSSSYSYYIFMGVKIAGEYNEPNYKQF
uniref:Uncharacterized protein n=1 Tax=Panagrolaimus sp. PS1159 TaxID=55785 RepID=A0AC35FLD2_9BILA